MKKVWFASILSLLGVLFAQEPIVELGKAFQLLGTRKYQDAAGAFEKVLSLECTQKQRTAAQLYRAICLGKLKKKAEALEAAELIDNPKIKVYAVMTILFDNGDSKGIVQQFGNEDLNAVPEEYAYYCWYLRGRAFGLVRQYDRALKELKTAGELAGSDTELLLLTMMDGATFAYTAKKPDLVLNITEKIMEPSFRSFAQSYMFLRPAGLRAEILIGQKRLDEAAAILAAFPKNLGQKQGVWDFRCQILNGDLALARGDRAAAKRFYDRAQFCAGKNAGLLKELRKKTDNLNQQGK
ncbi:MAG: hypothetical protein J5806_11520 [Lentisphaeria bacterium]|nr:hypothetical protein [Lentisphaeria bacterium]